MNKKETVLLGMYVVAHFGGKEGEPYFLASGGTFTSDAFSRSIVVFSSRRDADLKVSKLKERVTRNGSVISEMMKPMTKTLQVMQVGVRRA